MMSMNIAHNFIKTILHNSKLNREKFVRNKKIYNKMLSKNKNCNYIINRNFGTFHAYDFNNNNNNNNKNKLIYLVIALTTYHITKKFIEEKNL